MRNRTYYLRRAAVAVILLGVVLYHSAGLIRLLEKALTASPRWQASGIVFLAATVLLGRFLCNSGAAVVAGNSGPPVASIPLGVRLGVVTTSDLERWAEIHKNEGESTKDAVKRLEPVWSQRELGEDISITQRRRHEAAHAVITYILGGTVMAADVRADGDTADVPEILDLLIYGGPLDKWGHPVLDITEIASYLTDDANAEVLPR